jgi:hypothetical protein
MPPISSSDDGVPSEQRRIVMRQRQARAVARAQSSHENFAAWWATGMWILGAAYLLATLHPF